MRLKCALSLVLAAALLQGCAVRSGASWKPTPVPERVIEVFYATDRQPLLPGAKPCPAEGERPRAPRFGSERNQSGLALGFFPVRLPAGQKLDDIVDFKSRPECLEGNHPLYLAGPTPQSAAQFQQAVQEALTRASRKEILVYIHGYNNKFDEAVLWAGQLKHATAFDGVQVAYSWPSRGSKLSYATDSGNAEWTTPHLKEFLDALAAAHPGARIHLLAHSLGNRALLHALQRLATEQRSTPAPRFGQIILAAPVIDQDVFRQLIGPVLNLADRITLYTSAHDSALGASGWLFSYPRAGDSEYGLVLVPGMDTVDVTAVDKGGSRHNYFLDNARVITDIFQLLKYNAPPGDRFGLWRVETGDGAVWQFRP
jgi:esterase/lipase superfamily enzyme